MTEPNGNPCCFRESVERLPTRPRYTNVRARSANVGSAIAGCTAPEPACFPAVDEDILFSHRGFGTRSEISLVSWLLEQINTSRLDLPVLREMCRRKPILRKSCALAVSARSPDGTAGWS